MGRAGREAKVAAAAAERKAADLQKLLEAQSKNPDANRLELELELQRTKQAEAELRAEVETSRKTGAISKALKSLDLVDAELASRLIAEGVSYDPESKTYQATDASGNKISLEEAAKQFTSQYPYLVKSPMKPGQGSTSSNQSMLGQNDSAEQIIRSVLGTGYNHVTLPMVFGRGSSGVLSNEIAKKDYKSYQRLKAEAKNRGLI
jgi:hypothetical protein